MSGKSRHEYFPALKIISFPCKLAKHLKNWLELMSFVPILGMHYVWCVNLKQAGLTSDNNFSNQPVFSLYYIHHLEKKTSKIEVFHPLLLTIIYSKHWNLLVLSSLILLLLIQIPELEIFEGLFVMLSCVYAGTLKCEKFYVTIRN